MSVLELSHDQVRSLRDHLTRHRPAEDDLPLRVLDHRCGRVLGSDPYVLYQDILRPGWRGRVRPDGSIDLNACEAVLAVFGESDLNLAERVVSEWRDWARDGSP